MTSQRKIPTHDDLTKADLYAMSKLCKEIPSKYGVGLTEWDPRRKVCKITEKGCTAQDTNPISQKLYGAGGQLKEFPDYHRSFGDFWKHYEPEFLVWKSGPNGNKQCMRGNYDLQNWCENPRTRARGHQPGITNVIPFIHTVSEGKETCIIPKEYCDSKGVSYVDSNTGNCKVSGGQKFGEFLTGTVMVRSIKASDSRLKLFPKIFYRDYAGKGIHLYTFIWNNIGMELYGNRGYDIGFLADDIQKRDPDCVFIDRHGYKNINFTCLQSKKDVNMTKIINYLRLKQKMINSLQNNVI